MNQYIKSKQGEFEKVIEFFKKEILNIRTGRANPMILDGVMVDSYGVRTPMNSLASINVPDGQSLVVSPWDKNVMKDVEKAIVEANLGVGVVNEGDKIRITVPRMTEENRKELVKKINEKTEDARVSIRKIRDEIKQSIEKAKEEKEVNEDDKFRFLKELDEETQKQNENLKEIRDKKEEDIMTI
ncbi:MAG: ribosome recycling factor [bacterium]